MAVIQVKPPDGKSDGSPEGRMGTAFAWDIGRSTTLTKQAAKPGPGRGPAPIQCQTSCSAIAMWC